MADEDNILDINNAPENDASDRPFEEIDEAARAAELETRKREAAHENKVAAAIAAGKSRGKAQNKTVTAELIDAYMDFGAKYKNNALLKNAAKPENQTDEYTVLLGNAYKALFAPYNSAMETLKNFMNAGPDSTTVMAGKGFDVGSGIPAILSAFSAAEQNLERSLLYDKSDENTVTRELLTDIYDLHTTLERNAYGTLFVPHDDVKYDDKGKKIHRVTQQRDENGRWIQPEIEESRRKGRSNDAMFLSYPDYPLFDHEPNESDVQQGHLGNCYMMSVLASTAAEAPELIKDCMSFNAKNNTVTVRFYNDSQEPVYVTVDASVPMTLEAGPDGKLNSVSRPFSQRAYWVQLMEKAYTVSGLKKDNLKEAEKGTYKAKYTDINSGMEKNMFSQLFGYQTHDDISTMGLVDNAFDRPYDISRRVLSDIDVGSGNAPYTAEENMVYARIQRAFDKKHVVTTGINKDVKVPEGLLDGHAYSVLRVETDASTHKKYVVIRNPHARKGAEYDSEGKLVGSVHRNADGVSRVELRGFIKLFGEFTEAKHDTSFLTRAKDTQVKETLDKYKKAVDFFHKALEENDNGFLRAFGKNSAQFNALRTSALRAYSQFRNPSSSAEDMKQSVRDMVQAAKAYTQYRDARSAAGYDNTATRSVNRYNIASLVELVGEAFDKMEAPDSKVCRTVEPMELINKLKERGEKKNSLASSAAHEKLDKLEKKAVDAMIP